MYKKLRTIIESKRVSPWGDGKPAKSYTQKHLPIVWEHMLGTVRSHNRFHQNPDSDKAIKYHDYDYEKAHKWAHLDRYTDLRVAKVKRSYYGWPAKGRFALFGIIKPEFKDEKGRIKPEYVDKE